VTLLKIANAQQSAHALQFHCTPIAAAPSCSQLDCVEPWRSGATKEGCPVLPPRALLVLARRRPRHVCSTSSRKWHVGAGPLPPRHRPPAQHRGHARFTYMDGSFPSAAPSPKHSSSLTSTGASRSECRELAQAYLGVWPRWRLPQKRPLRAGRLAGRRLTHPFPASALTEPCRQKG
jgi:hypothetical protein